MKKRAKINYEEISYSYVQSSLSSLHKVLGGGIFRKMHSDVSNNVKEDTLLMSQRTLLVKKAMDKMVWGFL